MTTIRVTNTTRGTVLGTRIRLADSAAGRVRGFLFRPPPAAGEGILLSPCKAVHMFGVRFPLDVVFISAQGAVVATYPRLAPWRRSAVHGSALHALELPAGTIRATDTAVGDDLSWTATAGAPADADTARADAEREQAERAATARAAGADAGASAGGMAGADAGASAGGTAGADAGASAAGIEATPELPPQAGREPTRRHA